MTLVMIIDRKAVLAAIAMLAASGLPLSMNAHAPTPLTVRFYSEITRESCTQLRDSLSEKMSERSTMMSMLQSETPPPIHLHVNSRGGSLIEGLFMYDYLEGVLNLHTHVDGMVASAATLLTVGGARRTMTKNSMMLVHQPSFATEAGDVKYSLIRDEMVNIEKCMRALLEVYNATTTASFDELVTMVANEQMMTAPECLRYGFVDNIC